jgi:hypothetical protein
MRTGFVALASGRRSVEKDWEFLESRGPIGPSVELLVPAMVWKATQGCAPVVGVGALAVALAVAALAASVPIRVSMAGPR